METKAYKVQRLTYKVKHFRDLNSLPPSRPTYAIICPRDNLVGFVEESDDTIVLRNPATNALVKIPLTGVLSRYPDSAVVRAETKEKVFVKLAEARDKSATLDFTLMLFDKELPISLKKRAVEFLANLLINAKNRNYVFDIVLAAPLPAAADIDGALEVAHKSRIVLDLLSTIIECTLRSKLAFDAWLVTLSARLLPPHDKDRIYGILVGNGVFRRFVIEGKSQVEVNELVGKLAYVSNNVADACIISDFASEYKRTLPVEKDRPSVPDNVLLDNHLENQKVIRS